MKPLRAFLIVTLALMFSAIPACSKTKTNMLGMEFINIPSGSFTMGSTGYLDQGPPHHISISSFYLGKYEVTQEQWYKVMKNNPAFFKMERNSLNHPIENVSWNDVQQFIKRLNQMDKTNNYRLPTEAEWEYACRAGTTEEYSFGSKSDIGKYAWYKENSGDKTHPVGQKDPNKWGLHDMLGNVFEWCQDWYDKDYYTRSPSSHPQGPSSGSYRVIRGGAWFFAAEACRSANRGYFSPGGRIHWHGFRLVLLPRSDKN